MIYLLFFKYIAITCTKHVHFKIFISEHFMCIRVETEIVKKLPVAKLKSS